MSDQSHQAPCDSFAHLCVCYLPSGHAGPHSCPPSECSGQWLGASLDDPDFQVVSMPRPVAWLSVANEVAR